MPTAGVHKGANHWDRAPTEELPITSAGILTYAMC